MTEAVKIDCSSTRSFLLDGNGWIFPPLLINSRWAMQEGTNSFAWKMQTMHTSTGYGYALFQMKIGRACGEKLWLSDLSTRAKTFIWRVLAQGLFTGIQAARIGIDIGECKLCYGTIENIPHLFHDCEFALCWWKEGREAFEGTERLQEGVIIQILNSFTQKCAKSSIGYFLVYQILWSLWITRDGHVLGTASHGTFKLHSMLSEILHHIKAPLLCSGAGRKADGLAVVHESFKDIRGTSVRNRETRILSRNTTYLVSWTALMTFTRLKGQVYRLKVHLSLSISLTTC